MGLGRKKSETPEDREKRLEYLRKWKESNPSAHRDWADANKEYLAKYAREYRKRKAAEDPSYVERRREARRSYYEQNKDKIRESIREWRKNNPDFTKRKHGKRKAREYNAPANDLTASQWRSIVESYQGMCAYCGKYPGKITMDHVVPLAKGGGHTASNVVPACHACNSRKSDNLDWTVLPPPIEASTHHEEDE